MGITTKLKPEEPGIGMMSDPGYFLFGTVIKVIFDGAYGFSPGVLSV